MGAAAAVEAAVRSEAAPSLSPVLHRSDAGCDAPPSRVALRSDRLSRGESSPLSREAADRRCLGGWEAAPIGAGEASPLLLLSAGPGKASDANVSRGALAASVGKAWDANGSGERRESRAAASAVEAAERSDDGVRLLARRSCARRARARGVDDLLRRCRPRAAHDVQRRRIDRAVLGGAAVAHGAHVAL